MSLLIASSEGDRKPRRQESTILWILNAPPKVSSVELFDRQQRGAADLGVGVSRFG